jgi:hypothetical protein
MICVLTGLQQVILESQSVMNAVDGATIERRIRINRRDDENTRCGFPDFGFSPKIPLDARSRLQHFQRPTSSHLSKNPPSPSRVTGADVA